MKIQRSSSRIWFHGDASRRASFDDQRFQPPPDRDQNAMGPGIYFTSNESTARGYAWPEGYVYSAEVDGPFVTDETVADRVTVRRFIHRLPMEGRELAASNWDPDFAIGERKLIDAIMSFQSDFVSTFADIGRQAGLDYRESGREWCRYMVQTGFNGFIHKLPNEVHLIVWNPAAIHVISERAYYQMT